MTTPGPSSTSGGTSLPDRSLPERSLGQEPRRSRGGALVAAVVFVLLTAVPGVLYAAGVRAPSIDNRTVTPVPDRDAVLALDDAALAQLSDHLAETVPGRDLAVRLDAWTDLNVLRRSPNPDVVLGRDGWLFLRDTLAVPCQGVDRVGLVRSEMARATAMVESTGRRFTTVVAPDKGTIYPDRLRDVDEDYPCLAQVSSAIETRLEEDPPPGYQPFWRDVRDAAAASDEPIYFASDTHWTTTGSVEMAEAIVTGVDRSLLDDASRTLRDEESIPGDLSVLLGLVRTERETPVVFSRPGVDWNLRRGDSLAGVPDEVHPIDVNILEATGGRVAEGRTFLWHDSFANMVRPQLAPFFEQLVMVRKHPLAEGWVADLIASSDTVVYETVERELFNRWDGELVVAQLAWALRDDLDHTTLTVAPDADGWFTLPRDRFDILAVAPGLVPETPVGAAASQEADPDAVGGSVPTTFRLEVEGGTVEVLRHQRSITATTPRLFDLSRAGDDLSRVRVVDSAGEPVTVGTVALVATDTPAP